MANRREPKKPTRPYGYVSFPRRGPEERHLTNLPDHKDAIEREIGRKFVTALNRLGSKADFQAQLPEDDHDFIIEVDGKRIVVQAAELSDRAYLTELTEHEYREGRYRFECFELHEGKMYGVDTRRRNRAAIDVIEGKLAKRYSKPSDAFWLLLWTTASLLGPIQVQSGATTFIPAVLEAQAALAPIGSHPFDEVWYFYPDLRPARIWPV